jgi:hypothetical protein
MFPLTSTPASRSRESRFSPFSVDTSHTDSGKIEKITPADISALVCV